MTVVADARMLAAKTQTPRSKSAPPAEKIKSSAPLPAVSASNPVWSRLAWGIQPKLAVSAPGDPSEKEADRIADTVMRMPELAVQRKCAACSEGGAPCPSCEEETRVQRKADGVNGAGEVSSDFASRLGGGTPLDAGSRAFFEPRFGRDFGDVRVHADTQAAALARSVDARAFALGRNVVFAAGEYAPRSEHGRSLLAHELVHVAQQGGSTGVISRQPAEATQCPGYDSGEVARSQTANGQLAEDVRIFEPGRLLIADFTVDSSRLRNNTRDDPLLQQWLATFETDSSYRIEITGYSDCVGAEGNNTGLRQARASRIESLLGPGAQSRLQFRGMAALGQYVAPNDSADNRARNRGVVIEFRQEFTFDPETITAPNRCGPDSSDWLWNQMIRNRDHPVVRTSREVQWPNYIPFFNLGWNIGFLSDFRELVRAGGPWDFKSNQSRWRAGAGRLCPTPRCDRTVVLCGHCFYYDVPGNIHFGWIGRQAGLRAWFLHNRADAAQAGGVDDPRDAVAIDIGIAMADDGATLCGEIERRQAELNVDRTDGCSLCGVP